MTTNKNFYWELKSIFFAHRPAVTSKPVLTLLWSSLVFVDLHSWIQQDVSRCFMGYLGFPTLALKCSYCIYTSQYPVAIMVESNKRISSSSAWIQSLNEAVPLWPWTPQPPSTKPTVFYYKFKGKLTYLSHTHLTCIFMQPSIQFVLKDVSQHEKKNTASHSVQCQI